jgi:hypothetical protein
MCVVVCNPYEPFPKGAHLPEITRKARAREGEREREAWMNGRIDG